MKHSNQRIKTFIAGVLVALMASEVRLFAAIAPLRTELNSPISQDDNDAQLSAFTSVSKFELQTAQVNAELDLQRLYYLERTFAPQAIATEKYIPLSLKDGDSGANVTRKILQASIETWFNESDAKNTEVGRSLASLETGLNTEFVTSSNESLKFRVKPLTAVSEISYKGRVEAILAVKISNGDSSLKVFKNVNGTEYSYQVNSNSTESISTLNIGWAF